MELENDVETVYYVFPPFGNSEEISPSFLKDLAEFSDKDTDVADFMDCDDELLNANIQNETTILNEEQSGGANNVTPENVDRLTCKYCYQKFTKILTKQRHVKKVHNISRETGAHIKCVECSVTFPRVFKLREHLECKHSLNMTEEELCFPNMDAFKKWKHEIEQKTLCSYTLRHGSTKGPKGQGRKYFYSCHRSGKYMPKASGPRKRMLTQSTCRMGIVCTAAIICQENPSGVLVKYCPHHYGHKLETTDTHLSSEEQKVIAENLSKGVSFETVLDEIRDGQSSKDHFQLYMLKKKDINFINNAYDSDDFNTGISDTQNISHWVNMCNQLKNSPILYYQHEKCDGSDRQESFILIIMTDYQKHVLLSSSKKVFCVDSLYRKRSGNFYLTILFITGKDDLAFPVAFCISDKLEKSVFIKFFHSICQSTGPLAATYFISDCDSFYYESWKDVMKDSSKWLWSMWSLDSKIRRRLNIFKGNATKRADVYKTTRMLLECQNETVFLNTLEKFIENLLNDPQSKDLGNFVKQNYASNPEIWAYCYRKEISLSANIHLEIMHQVFRFCCGVGRKKRLDKFIFVVMKLLRNKMLNHLLSTIDDNRISLMKTAITTYHSLGLEIPTDCISAISDKMWLIKSSKKHEGFHVRQECTSCPEHCNLKCLDCDICVHMYACSCVHNMINADICQHIHAVVWNLFPHFPIPISPRNNSESTDTQCSKNLQSVLKKTCEVYKKIQKNKLHLSESSLAEIMKRMNECLDICSGEKVVDKSSDITVSSNAVKPLASNQSSIINSSSLLSMTTLLESSNNQSFTLPTQVSTVLTNHSPSQYVMLIPNNIVS